MKHSFLRRSCLFSWVGLLAVACGGGGGGGGTATATISGQVRLPALAPGSFGSTFPVTEPMEPGEVVVWLENGAAAQDLASDDYELVRSGGPVAVFRARAAAARETLERGAALAQSAEWATCEAAEQMGKMHGVRCASPNYMLQATVQPNDTFYVRQWHYPQINLEQAWGVTQGSSNVIVAVLDTGIVSAHPEFTGRLTSDGFDMISNPATARDGDGRDPNPEDRGDLLTPQGSSFHGTHVAGTIGANGNNGAGVAGVDWNCKLMIVRVLGRGGGSIDDIANGILYAARLTNASGQLPAQRADVINMSLGGPGGSAVLEQACNAAANAGVLLVAAAGNDNSAAFNSPGGFDSVLSVGAVDLVRARAPYSNFSPTVDIWAPGGDMTADRNGDSFPDGVLSCMANDQGQLFFAFENGTSMASPHVAGVAALVKARNPSLTAGQIRTILINSATPVAGLPNNGRLVDALAAVQAAGGGAPAVPILVATPAAVDFGGNLTQVSLTLENRGAGNLVFDSFAFQPAAPWFDGTLVDATPSNGIVEDRLDVTVNRTGLQNGVYQTRLTLNYVDVANGSALVSVDIDFRIQVGASPASNDTVFIVLVDPETLEARFQVQTTAGSSFEFAMGSITPGTYLLVAGTDRDNDGFIGDPGELFGAWPSLDAPQAIVIGPGDNLTGRDFAMEDLATMMSVGPEAGLRAVIRRLL
jgi:serine protease